MNDEVFLADRREAVAAVIAQALGMARVVGNEFKIGPIEAFDGTPVVDIKSASTRADG